MKLKSIFAHLVLLGAVVILTANSSFAQQEASAGSQLDSGQIQKSVVLEDQKLTLNFVITAKLGSVTIQVLHRRAEELSQAPAAISGFKVRLRSGDAGFERWYLDQFTDDEGRYTFECLRPGKYFIELDPADL